MAHNDPDYIRHEHQKRAAKGGEIAPNGEFYKGGAWIATKEDRPKGLRVADDGAVSLDGKSVTPRQRKAIFAELEAMGVWARFDKSESVYEFGWNLFDSGVHHCSGIPSPCLYRLYTAKPEFNGDLCFTSRAADVETLVRRAFEEIAERDRLFAEAREKAASEGAVIEFPWPDAPHSIQVVRSTGERASYFYIVGYLKGYEPNSIESREWHDDDKAIDAAYEQHTLEAASGY